MSTVRRSAARAARVAPRRPSEAQAEQRPVPSGRERATGNLGGSPGGSRGRLLADFFIPGSIGGASCIQVWYLQSSSMVIMADHTAQQSTPYA